jgi:hypothetical protein
MTLALPDLRKALASVVPHSEPTKTGDEISHLSRVRLSATKDELLVMATNSTTAALAAVAIEEDSRRERFAADDGAFQVDVSPGPLRNVLQAFKVGKDSVDAEAQWCEVAFDIEHLTITDTSALFPGLSLRIPLTPRSDQFPDVAAILKRALGSAGESPIAKPLVSGHPALALFRAAGQQYKQPLQFEGFGSAESRGFIVLCGPSFCGVVSSRHNDDDSLARRDAERRKHLDRLGLTERVLAA